MMRWCVLWALFSVAVWAETPAIQLQLYTEHMPPYSYLEQDKVDGINVALLRQLCERTQVQCQFELLPWPRAFEQAQQQPMSGVFSTSRNEAREPLFQWVGPLASDWGYLFRLRGRAEVNPADLEEAKTFKLAVARGDVYESYFKERGFQYGVNMLDFATKSEPVPLFLARRIDLLVGSKRSVRSWLQQHGADEASAEAWLKLEDVGDNYLALHPSTPASLVQRLQQGLDRMHQEGVVQTLIEQYTQD